MRGTSGASDDVVRARILSLPDRFRPEVADGIAAEWELRVGRVVYTVSVADGSCFAREGPSRSAAVRLAADAGTWLAVDEGALSGTQALMARRLSVRGNLDLAARFPALFEPHGRPRRTSDLEQVELRADGLPVSAYLFGEGPPVVFLHGLGASKISWLPVLHALAERFRVLAPDLPGHGESEKPRTGYTPRFYAGVVRRLMGGTGMGRAALVGNSMGGRVAMELAARAPDLVMGLALVAPAVPGLAIRYVLGFTRVLPSELGAIPFPIRERWMELVVRRLFARPERLPAEAYRAAADEFVRLYRSPAARMAFLDSLRHLVAEAPGPFWSRMERISAPTLALWGARDRVVPVRLARRLTEALPQAELVVLRDVGHVPQFEAPEHTTRILSRFLEGLPGGRRPGPGR